jgi:UDP-N-acetylglucosamine 4,6-dehydratase
MMGGEVFIPKIPSMGLVDLAEALAPGCKHEYLGIRPGEKLHEILLTDDEARSTVELDDMFIVKPPSPWYFGDDCWPEGAALPAGFRYSSDTNAQWLNAKQLMDLIEYEQTDPLTTTPSPVGR